MPLPCSLPCLAFALVLKLGAPVREGPCGRDAGEKGGRHGQVLPGRNQRAGPLFPLF